MEFCITKKELEKALEKLNVAINNGFTESYAVLKIHTGGEFLSDFLSRYESVILRTNTENFGRTNYPEWETYV